MSETAFTPGPWTVVPYGDGDSLVIHSSDENRVCFMATHGGSRKSWETIQANANAIAALPDLYEALRLLVADVAQYEAWQRPCHALDVAHAALAKCCPPQDVAAK